MGKKRWTSKKQKLTQQAWPTIIEVPPDAHCPPLPPRPPPPSTTQRHVAVATIILLREFFRPCFKNISNSFPVGADLMSNRRMYGVSGWEERPVGGHAVHIQRPRRIVVAHNLIPIDI